MSSADNAWLADLEDLLRKQEQRLAKLESDTEKRALADAAAPGSGIRALAERIAERLNRIEALSGVEPLGKELEEGGERGASPVSEPESRSDQDVRNVASREALPGGPGPGDAVEAAIARLAEKIGTLEERFDRLSRNDAMAAPAEEANETARLRSRIDLLELERVLQARRLEALEKRLAPVVEAAGQIGSVIPRLGDRRSGKPRKISRENRTHTQRSADRLAWIQGRVLTFDTEDEAPKAQSARAAISARATRSTETQNREAMAITKHGTVAVGQEQIVVEGFEFSDGSSREAAIMAAAWAIGKLQREMMLDIQAPGGGNIVLEGRRQDHDSTPLQPGQKPRQ